MNKMLLILSLVMFSEYISAQTDSAKIDSLPIFIDPEISPSFPGGDPALNAYILSNLKFPTCFHEEDLGTVYVSFIVEEEGVLSEIKIIRGLGAGFDDEAIRLIQQMPNWAPGSIYGKPVRSRFIIPINFRLL